MGKPGGGNAPSPPAEKIGRGGPTQGSETSQYLEERKSNETPPVAASEGGIAQTGLIRQAGVAGAFTRLSEGRETRLERRAKEGESPVPEARARLNAT